jgi:hypothetical protein
MEGREDQLDRRDIRFLMDIDGDAAPLVLHGDGSVFVDGQRHLIAVAVDRFVNAVIDDFPNQMVEAGAIGRPDIHTGTLPHTLHLTEELNAIRIVCSFSGVKIYHGIEFSLKTGVL